MLRAVGFDLDNTLYDQSSHMIAFIGHTVNWLSEKAKVVPSVVEDVFVKKFCELTAYHGHLFDEVLKELHVPIEGNVHELVNRYHHFRTELSPFPDTRPVLERLSRKYQLFMITDGNLEMQRWKVESLKIAGYFSLIIYTGQFGPDWMKPSPIPFRFAAESLGRAPNQCVYVGDNPLSDFRGARDAGLSTIRVLTGPFADYLPTEEQSPRYVAKTIAAVDDILVSHDRHEK